MNKKRVLVVLGGTSGERQVSLETGKACLKALKKKGYKTSTFDPQKRPLNLIDKNKVDIIFNALHGKDGEDGVAQSYFEYLKIPYTHSGIISSYNAMNKVISKEIFKKYKIVTPNYFILKFNELNKKNLKNCIKKRKIKFPVVVKPTNEGSSIGVKICKNLSELQIAAKALYKKYHELIYETFIGGQEIQVAVINGTPLGAIELKPKRKFYDYEAKYNSNAKTQHIIPVDLPKNKLNQVLNIAYKAHKAIGCKGVTRSDFKFSKGKFYILEINTQPGMTKLSLVPEIAAYKRINFLKLIEWILRDASNKK